MQPGLFTASRRGDVTEYVSRLTGKVFTLTPTIVGYNVETEGLLIVTPSRGEALRLIELADELE